MAHGQQHHEHSHYHLHSNERSTKLVVAISVIAMLLELYFGYVSQSVALIMDGWHMLSHVLVILLAWLTYVYIQRYVGSVSQEKEHRILSLSALASSIVLLLVTLLTLLETIEKILQPALIVTNEAILVAVIGFFVNGVSAYFLHREEDNMDLNMRAAYTHVLSDVLLSTLAISSLLAAKYFSIHWLDPVLGLLGSAIISKWAIDLIKKSWRGLGAKH